MNKNKIKLEIIKLYPNNPDMWKKALDFINSERYDETLDNAKVVYKTIRKDLKPVIEQIFPELKEGEDEEIRKALIKGFKGYKGWDEEWFYGITVREAIDWLEKQGEPVEINPTEFDTRLQALIARFSGLLKEELIGSLSFWLNAVKNDGTYKGEENQGEQKPVWSEEDKNAIQVLKDIVRHSNEIDEKIYTMSLKEKLYDWLKSLKNRVIPQPKSEWSEEDERMVRIIESTIRNSISDNGSGLAILGVIDNAAIGAGDVLNWLKYLKDRVQPKIEWSEEDEAAIGMAIIALEDMYNPDTPNTTYAGYSMPFNEAAKRLKSLSPKWKPNEEQMKALNTINVTGCLSYVGQGQVLIDLYNDLRQLKQL